MTTNFGTTREVTRQDIRMLTTVLWLVLAALVVLIMVSVTNIVDDHVDFRRGGGGESSQVQQD